MEEGARHFSAPGADMDRRVVIDIFFVAANERLA